MKSPEQCRNPSGTPDLAATTDIAVTDLCKLVAGNELTPQSEYGIAL